LWLSEKVRKDAVGDIAKDRYIRVMAKQAKSGRTVGSTEKDTGRVRGKGDRWVKREATSGKLKDSGTFQVVRPAVTSRRFTLADARAAVRKLNRDEHAKK
jgi:hypothetical protein